MTEQLEQLFSEYLDAILHHSKNRIHDARQNVIDYIYEIANGDEQVRATMFMQVDTKLKQHFSDESLDTKKDFDYTSNSGKERHV